MKRISKVLMEKATDSLLLSIELYNRPFERGRVHASLILLDHAFEMLLKASLIQREVKINDKKTKQTYGFEKCVRLAMGDGNVRFLTNEQAITLQMINSTRDSEQHYFIEISEEQHYVLMQAGVTLFKDILNDVFGKNLSDYMPPRVLPVSTIPPKSIDVLFDNEIKQIKNLIIPGKRKKSLALARLRSMEIMEAAINGDSSPITDASLRKKLDKIQEGTEWQDIFPGVASLNLNAEGNGLSINLRFTKKEGIPIHTVPEGTDGTYVVGIKRVNELGYYNMGRNQLAKALNLSTRKTDALIWYLNLKENEDCCRKVYIGKTKYYKYSQEAIRKVSETLNLRPLSEIWDIYRNRNK